MEIAGELAQACVHVLGLSFVAYEVVDEVYVGDISIAAKACNSYSG